MNLKLVSPNSEILHKKLKEFDFAGDMSPIELADSLHDTMKKLGGVGLSANQVGIDARVFVMGIGEETRIDVFNPEILNYVGSDVMLTEGCLSYPAVVMNMIRPSAIHVRFKDKYGNTKEEVFSKIFARIFLHEYDHMEGITFKDKVSKMKWDLAIRRRTKRIKKEIKEILKK
jgi:peptide deformylase